MEQKVPLFSFLLQLIFANNSDVNSKLVTKGRIRNLSFGIALHALTNKLHQATLSVKPIFW